MNCFRNNYLRIKKCYLQVRAPCFGKPAGLGALRQVKGGGGVINVNKLDFRHGEDLDCSFQGYEAVWSDR
jgi:hypothetical protein